MSVLHVAQGDTRPRHQVALTYADGSAVDLTGATIRYLLREVNQTSLTVAAAAAIVGTASLGVCEYVWTDGDTDVAGSYDAEFEVTFSDGTVQTFPTRRPLRVVIRGDLDV